jgi:hypothetical protein|tara:strand:+ start:814 stop:921 length:108 start_codon:yes stop_codon:yes gene_type:complete
MAKAGYSKPEFAIKAVTRVNNIKNIQVVKKVLFIF